MCNKLGLTLRLSCSRCFFSQGSSGFSGTCFYHHQPFSSSLLSPFHLLSLPACLRSSACIKSPLQSLFSCLSPLQSFFLDPQGVLCAPLSPTLCGFYPLSIIFPAACSGLPQRRGHQLRDSIKTLEKNKLGLLK